MAAYPSRIVCLTEETTETLYLLGEGDRVVGVSGYTARPPEARQKPKVSAFINARFEKIEALKPDLVLAFSDLQAGIAADLARAGIAVHLFNQRDLAECLAMIRTVGALVGVPDEADALARGYEERIARTAATPPGRRPNVYFEEWDEPMICGIGWVSDLIAAAGGLDVFSDRSRGKAARDRFVTSDDVIAAAPEVILASWCGKRVNVGRIRARPGWEAIPAVARGRIHEIKSPLILQPGPAALTDGFDAIRAALSQVG